MSIDTTFLRRCFASLEQTLEEMEQLEGAEGDVVYDIHGSRINGRSHNSSDLDLALRAPELAEIPIDPLVDFEEVIRESGIPFLIEARNRARLTHTMIEFTTLVFLRLSGSDNPWTSRGAW